MAKEIVVLICDPACSVPDIASLGPGVRYDPTTRQILAIAGPPPVDPPPVVPDPPVIVPAGKIHKPKTGAELQQAIDRAEGGEEIHLDPSIAYTGNFNLTAKAAPVVIRPLDLSPFTPGRRVNPSQAAGMGRLRSPNTMATLTVAGSNWKLAGLDIGGVANLNHTVNIVMIGDENAPSLAVLPQNVDIDRCYIHGDQAHGTRRGVFVMGRQVRVRDSYIADCFARGNEAQAVGVFESQGVDVENSYLSGAGENFFVASIGRVMRGVFPSEITLKRCHLFKRPEWREGTQRPIVKNLLEIKSGVRVLIEGNVFDGIWPAGQSGYAMLLTNRDENGDRQAEISNICVRLNKFLNISNGFNILGKDDAAGNIGRLFDVLIEHNWIDSEVGRFAQMLNGIEGIAFRHNTALRVATSICASGQGKSKSLEFIGNAIGHGTYGIHHDGTKAGIPSLEAFWESYKVEGNVFHPPSPYYTYPPGNTFVKDATSVPAGAGCDMAALEAAIAGVVQ